MANQPAALAGRERPVMMEAPRHDPRAGRGCRDEGKPARTMVKEAHHW
jgi:hypothetical protein